MPIVACIWLHSIFDYIYTYTIRIIHSQLTPKLFMNGCFYASQRLRHASIAKSRLPFKDIYLIGIANDQTTHILVLVLSTLNVLPFFLNTWIIFLFPFFLFFFKHINIMDSKETESTIL